MSYIHKLIESTIKYLENQSSLHTQPSFPLTEAIALAAAFFSLVGLISTAIYTVNKNTKLQNANARVEWIQKVRNVTAELISTYSSALNEDDNAILERIIVNAREKVELLILYFGPEKTISTHKIDLMSKNTNDGRNDLILEFLIDLSRWCLHEFMLRCPARGQCTGFEQRRQTNPRFLHSVWQYHANPSALRKHFPPDVATCIGLYRIHAVLSDSSWEGLPRSFLAT